MKNKILRQFPFYVILLSVYPILSVYALNIEQINGSLIIRSLIISFGFSIAVLVILWAIMRSWFKAGLITGLLQVLFFSYGHIYGALEKVFLGTFRLGQHKMLIPLYLVLFGLGLWLILKRKKNTLGLTIALDLFAIFLFLFPIITVIGFSISKGTSQVQFNSGDQKVPEWIAHATNVKPDIYYIILDTYTRSDSLLADFGYDNSGFEEALRERGFYVADCSQANYDFTLASLATSLNLSYMDDLENVLSQAGISNKNIWLSIKHSLTRFYLEQLGYTVIAFDTGYEWSQITDADIYYPLEVKFGNFGLLNPFETLLLRTTAVDVIMEWNIQSSMNRSLVGSHPFEYHIELEQFLLSQMVDAASLRGPKFVFVHILIPHVPYVFAANGSINTDAAFFSGKDWGAADEEHTIGGYVGEVQFINDRILQAVDEILARSESTPIIILQGDHGLRDDNRQKILNAYLLPDIDQEKMYSSISPVNTFRFIFDEYFGADLGLLQDESYRREETYQIVPETASQCLDKP